MCSGVIYSPNSACCLGINTLRAEKATTLGDKMEVGRGLEKRNMREKDGELDQKGRNYEKKLTVLVEIEGEDRITMMELLKKVREDCGVVIGCRYKTPKEYELTMEEDKGKEKFTGWTEDKEKSGDGERGGLYGDGGVENSVLLKCRNSEEKTRRLRIRS